MNSIRRGAERHFGLKTLGTSVRTEVAAGATTFLSMSYIIAVNPAILSDAGIPAAAAAFATCLVSGLGSVAMGLWAKAPIAVAPGMGLNAFFTYTVVLGAGLSWQQGLGMVFVSGLLFVVLTLTGMRQAILEALPKELRPAIGAGIGMFLVMIGLRNGGIIDANEATLVTLGELGSPTALVTIGTALLIATLLSRGVRSGLLLGIVAATLISIPIGLARGQAPQQGGMLDAAFQLDVGPILSLSVIDLLLAMVFVDLFDSLGTMVGVISKARLSDEGGRVPRLGRMLVVDGAATISGALAGTSTVTAYIESAAGVEAGGRSGLTAVVTGMLFLLALPLSAAAVVVPTAAVAGALVVIGATTVGFVRSIDWDDVDTALPALLVIAGMPLTFSIADGLSMGLIAYSALKILRGRAGQVPWTVHVLAVVILARYVFFA